MEWYFVWNLCLFATAIYCHVVNNIILLKISAECPALPYDNIHFSVFHMTKSRVFFCGGLKLTSQSLWKVRYVAIWQLRSNSRLFLYLLSSPLTCSRSKSQKWQIIMSFIIITYINIVSYEVLPHRSESIWISTKTLSCTTIPNLIGNANNVPWLLSI